MSAWQGCAASWVDGGFRGAGRGVTSSEKRATRLAASLWKRAADIGQCDDVTNVSVLKCALVLHLNNYNTIYVLV